MKGRRSLSIHQRRQVKNMNQESCNLFAVQPEEPAARMPRFTEFSLLTEVSP